MGIVASAVLRVRGVLRSGRYRQCMLTAIALVPGTALLVPGAGGRCDAEMVEVRSAALDAVRAVLSAGTRRVVVVAPGAMDRYLPDAWRASLGAAGVTRSLVGWSMPERRGAGGARGPVTSTVTSAALALVAHAAAGPAGRAVEDLAVEVLEVSAGASRAADLQSRGRDLTRPRDPDLDVGLVVVGCLSARDGERAPLAPDVRASGVDAALAADLADGGPEARARIAALPGEVADELGISGWAPWQVLVGACGPTVRVAPGTVHTDSHLGVTYVSASWRLLGDES